LRNPAPPKGWLKAKQNNGMFTLFTIYQLVISQPSTVSPGDFFQELSGKLLGPRPAGPAMVRLLSGGSDAASACTAAHAAVSDALATGWVVS
jgi:hypothetical protein